MTPASRSMRRETSPVCAPSSSAARVLRAQEDPRALQGAAHRVQRGEGRRDHDLPARLRGQRRRPARRRARPPRATVLYIFQLPAMNGLSHAVLLVLQRHDAGQLLAFQELQGRAAARWTRA